MKKENFSLSISDKSEIPQMCFGCGEDDVRILKKFEKHHIFAKVNSDENILLCPNCHGKITSRQNSISPNKRNNKLAFQLLTQGELFKIVGDNQINIAKKLFENGKNFS